MEQFDIHTKKKRKKELNQYVQPYTKIYSEQIIDLNIKSKTFKLSKKTQKIYVTLAQAEFFTITTKAQSVGEKIHKFNFIKIKNF